MKRLMIVGASILQVPAIKKAKEMGLYVGVADYSPNAVGIALADEYFNVSTIDEEGVYQSAREFRADGIMTLATDMPMRAVAYTCERMGLSGISYDTAIKATDKLEMIQAFEANDIAHPWYQALHGKDRIDAAVINSLSFPCIVKPTDSSGSRGVTFVNSVAELNEAINYSIKQSRKGSVIIEEFLSGPEVSVEVVVLNGVPYVLQVTDKLTTGMPHFVEMGHSQPSQLPADELKAIRSLAASASLAVGIHNGPAHVEIILTENGPKLVELGARLGGDCITTHLVPLSTGIDIVKAAIQIALGEKPNLEQRFNRGSAIRYFKATNGIIVKIDGINTARQIEGIREIIFTKQVGEQVGCVHSSEDRIGFVIAQHDTVESAVKICKKVLDNTQIITEMIDR